nr:hypothetical protein [Mycobacterium riyadhense]
MGGHAGAQHVDTVEGGFGGDLVVFTGDGQAGVGDPALKVLAHLVLVDHLAHCLTDVGGPGECAAGYPVGDRAQ